MRTHIAIAIALNLCLCVGDSLAGEPDDALAAIREQIRAQEEAWNDLRVEYRLEVWMPGPGDEFERRRDVRMRWMATRDGWERLTRMTRTQTGQSAARDWIEEAAFDGELCMTWDNQAEGSARIGHHLHSFLFNSDSLRTVLDVACAQLGAPLSLSQYLALDDVEKRVSVMENGAVEVVGDDPCTDRYRLVLRLDPGHEYGMSYRRRSDNDSAISISVLQVEEFQMLQGRHPFWFPRAAVWTGIDPKTDTPLARTKFLVDRVDVNSGLTREDFRLTYPKGTLLVNGDTGENVYLTADSTLEDIPHFRGKTMTLAEHDRLAAQVRGRERLADTAHTSREGEQIPWWRKPIFMVNALAAAILLGWLAFRRFASR